MSGSGTPGGDFLYCADSLVTPARVHGRGEGFEFSACLHSTFFSHAGKIVRDLPVIFQWGDPNGRALPGPTEVCPRLGIDCSSVTLSLC